MSIFHCCFLTMTIVSLKQLHKNRLTDTELDSTPDIPANDFVFLTHTHQGQRTRMAATNSRSLQGLGLDQLL